MESYGFLGLPLKVLGPLYSLVTNLLIITKFMYCLILIFQFHVLGIQKVNKDSKLPKQETKKVRTQLH